MDTAAIVENSPIAQEIAGKVISAVNQTPEITYQHIALTIIGALIVNLMNYDEFKKSGDRLGFMVWLDKNWISLIMSSLSLVTMFLLKGELKDIAGFDMSNRLGCFLAGFTAHAFVNMAKSASAKRFGKTASDTSDSNNTN
jgi:hypothetical protein